MNNLNADLEALLDYSHRCAKSYIQNIAARNVFPDASAINALQEFDEELPEKPTDSLDILKKLHNLGSPATVAQTGGRYFGFVNGGMLPAGLAAKWLSDAWDQNAALYVMSPIASKLESVCQDWLRELLQLPAQTVAGFVSGTSTATVCGLAAGYCGPLCRDSISII